MQRYQAGEPAGIPVQKAYLLILQVFYKFECVGKRRCMGGKKVKPQTTGFPTPISFNLHSLSRQLPSANRVKINFFFFFFFLGGVVE